MNRMHVMKPDFDRIYLPYWQGGKTDEPIKEYKATMV